MKILGLDFETQSAVANSTNVTEVGAVLLDWHQDDIDSKNDSFEVEDQLSSLVWEKDYPPQTPAIADLTGITDEMLVREGRSRGAVMASLVALLERADIVLAHKIAFDKTVLESTCAKLGLNVPKKEWLCTLTNFPWPKNLTCHKLSHLAYEHGIMRDPRTLHRASDDVKLMLELVTTKYDFTKVLEYARTPWIYAKADVVGPWKDGGKQTNEAKLLGFSFESVKGTDWPKWPKTWVTRIKGQDNFDQLVQNARACEAPFRVARIEGIQ